MTTICACGNLFHCEPTGTEATIAFKRFVKCRRAGHPLPGRQILDVVNSSQTFTHSAAHKTIEPYFQRAPLRRSTRNMDASRQRRSWLRVPAASFFCGCTVRRPEKLEGTDVVKRAFGR